MIDVDLIKRCVIPAILLLLLCNICLLKPCFSKSVPVRVSDEEYKRIIGKKYEIISDIIYLGPKDKSYPYRRLAPRKSEYAFGMRKKEFIKIPLGAIFKICYITQTKAFPDNFSTHYVAKFETPGIYDEEFEIAYFYLMKFNNNIPGGFNAALDTRFNERFIGPNPSFLKEHE